MMKAVACLLVVVLCASHSSAAIVLDFESFRVDDAVLRDHPGIITIGGFTIMSVPPAGNAFLYRSAGTQNALFAGSTGIFNGQSNAENVLTQSSGSEFSLFSIDLAVLPPGANDPTGPTDPGPFDLAFTGALAGGGTVSNTFTINNTFLTFERFNFVGIEHVVSVSWFQGPGFSPGTQFGRFDPTHQFDNIVVSAVPEPSTSTIAISLLCAGFIASSRRRRNEYGLRSSAS